MFEALRKAGITLRRGQLCLICAGPGTGKSIFTLSYALKSAVPTLYLSADSDAFTQLTRAISVLTGKNNAESVQAVLQDRLAAVEEVLRQAPIRFGYEASPTIDTIETTMAAYEEVYGEYPALVVLDNLTDVVMDSEDEGRTNSLDGLLRYLKTMSRATGCTVMVLHHVTSKYNDGTEPIPLSGILDQVSKIPELILTLHKPYGDTLCVSPVKQRGGKNDPSGRSYAELEFRGESMLIRDFAR